MRRTVNVNEQQCEKQGGIFRRYKRCTRKHRVSLASFQTSCEGEPEDEREVQTRRRRRRRRWFNGKTLYLSVLNGLGLGAPTGRYSRPRLEEFKVEREASNQTLKSRAVVWGRTPHTNQTRHDRQRAAFNSMLAPVKVKRKCF